jgi:hypothetical protein
VAVVLDNYELLSFYLEASVQYHAAYLADKVQSSIEDALKEAFAFAERGFGQPVTAAGIVSAVHQVGGVIAVDLDALYAKTATGKPIVVLRPATLSSHRAGFLGIGGMGLSPGISIPAGPAAAEKAKTAAVLPAKTARRENGKILPAQLLLLDQAGIHLTMKAV